MPDNENTNEELNQTAEIEQEQSNDALVEMTKNYTEAEMNTLPKSLRDEIEQAKNGVEPRSQEETETKVETPVQEKSLDDINKSLVEELNKSNARYSTLNGKYLAEGERQRNRIAELELELAKFKESGDGDYEDSDNTPDIFADGNSGNDNEFSDADLLKEGRELGIDENVVRFLGKVANSKKADRYGAELDSRISAIEARGLTEDLESKLTHTTGISIQEFENQPLRGKYLNDLVDENGVSAMQAIIDAKNHRDNGTIVNVVSQVVNAMKANGEWYDGSSFRGNGARHSEPNTGRAENFGDMPVTPHSSGGSAGTPDVRGLDSIDAELNNALLRLQRGDVKMASKINQLKRERLKYL